MQTRSKHAWRSRQQMANDKEKANSSPSHPVGLSFPQTLREKKTKPAKGPVGVQVTDMRGSCRFAQKVGSQIGEGQWVQSAANGHYNKRFEEPGARAQGTTQAARSVVPGAGQTGRAMTDRRLHTHSYVCAHTQPMEACASRRGNCGELSKGDIAVASVTTQAS